MSAPEATEYVLYLGMCCAVLRSAEHLHGVPGVVAGGMGVQHVPRDGLARLVEGAPLLHLSHLLPRVARQGAGARPPGPGPFPPASASSRAQHT